MKVRVNAILSIHRSSSSLSFQNYPLVFSFCRRASINTFSSETFSYVVETNFKELSSQRLQWGRKLLVSVCQDLFLNVLFVLWAHLDTASWTSHGNYYFRNTNKCLYHFINVTRALCLNKRDIFSASVVQVQQKYYNTTYWQLWVCWNRNQKLAWEHNHNRILLSWKLRLARCEASNLFKVVYRIGILSSSES